MRAMGLFRERLIARKHAPTGASQIMDNGSPLRSATAMRGVSFNHSWTQTQRRSALAREKLSRQRPPPKRALRRGVR